MKYDADTNAVCIINASTHSLPRGQRLDVDSKWPPTMATWQCIKAVL